MLLIKTPPYDPGMFSCFATVLGAIYEYEIGKLKHTGIRVEFDSGRYFERSHGPNWWTYHMEPIEIGEQNDDPCVLSNHNYYGYLPFKMERSPLVSIATRYMKPRREVVDIVDAFHREHLASRFVLGVHFRGTDKKFETKQFLDAPEVMDQVAAKFADLKSAGKNPVIFGASDEERFIRMGKLEFGDDFKCTSIARVKGRYGSDGGSLHYTMDRPFEQGRDALVDCLLLARSNFLMRTTSNMGFFAELFSPEMESLRMNDSTFELPTS